MYKNTFLCLLVLNKSIALFIIKKSNSAFPDKIRRINVLLFRHANLNIFQFYIYFFSWIGRCCRNITVLIKISKHLFQAFPFFSILLPFQFSFFFFFPFLLFFLLSFLFVP